MKNRNEKQQDLDKLKTELAKVSTVILSTFQGITVEDDTKLRRAVQAAGGKYKVVKNTLAERAGAGTPAENLLKNLSGTNSIAYTAADPVALAKALTKVAKDVPASPRRQPRWWRRAEAGRRRAARHRRKRRRNSPSCLRTLAVTRSTSLKRCAKSQAWASKRPRTWWMALRRPSRKASTRTKRPRSKRSSKRPAPRWRSSSLP